MRHKTHGSFYLNDRALINPWTVAPPCLQLRFKGSLAWWQDLAWNDFWLQWRYFSIAIHKHPGMWQSLMELCHWVLHSLSTIPLSHTRLELYISIKLLWRKNKLPPLHQWNCHQHQTIVKGKLWLDTISFDRFYCSTMSPTTLHAAAAASFSSSVTRSWMATAILLRYPYVLAFRSS